MAFVEKLKKLDDTKKRLLNGEECVNYVINDGGLAELFSFLPSYEAKDGSDYGVIDGSLESLLKISINCFYGTVSRENQNFCIERLRDVNGYNILSLLYKTYTTEKFKDHIAIILGRFHDGIALPTAFQSIIPGLKNIIVKNSSKDTSKALYYVNLALVSLTSIANYYENKKQLIYNDIQTAVLPLLTSTNSNVAVHSLTLLSNFCSVGSPEVKNKIIKNGIFQHFLPLLHYFSQGLPLNPVAGSAAIPVATTVNNVCALIGMLISENEAGIDKFLRAGLVPLFCVLLNNRPSTVTLEEFERIACNILNTFVVSAAQNIEQTNFLLTFPRVLPLVAAVLQGNGTPDTEAPLVFAAIKVFYTLALKGADPSTGSPTNIFKETVDGLDVVALLHGVFQYVHAIPSNTLAPSQTDAIRQAALAVALFLKGTQPALEEYDKEIQVLKTLKNLPIPTPPTPNTTAVPSTPPSGAEKPDEYRRGATSAPSTGGSSANKKLEEYRLGAQIALEGLGVTD